MLRKKEQLVEHPWTIEEIELGILEFKKIFGRLPTAQDFDRFEFLPTARLIQRNYGGLTALRSRLSTTMNEPLDYTKGEVRSKKAKDLHSRAVDYEEKFYSFLVTVFPEVRIHEHKIIRPGHVCCDFYIYGEDNSGVIIDLFYAQDISSLCRVVNIKIGRYQLFREKTYFILIGNNQVIQKEIDFKMANRKNKLPPHIKVLTEQTFKELIKSPKDLF